ncbi:hypothetical protein JW835_03825 [bacterium]|nr:hypothetical protein [bacterium]RQV97925.1 MAG: hypothetical protein EH221_02925 [bacterium]
MKRLMIILTVLISVLAINASEISQAKLSTAKAMYIRGVKSDNIGLRCNAIFRIAEMKSRFPEMSTKGVEKILQKAARKDENSLVRAYAGLTLVYLKDTKLNQKVKVIPREVSIDFYQRLQQAIYANTYAMNLD